MTKQVEDSDAKANKARQQLDDATKTIRDLSARYIKDQKIDQ